MFKNRIQAGRLLGEKIRKDLGEIKEEMVVLGIPRGGVVVAKQVIKVLGCGLDVVVTKKIGAPGQPELAIGAVGETEGSKYLDERLVQELRLSADYLKEEIKRKKTEIKRREELYRQGKQALDLKNKIVIIVDDGAATGATIIAGAREVWNNNPRKVIIGLPVVAKDTLRKLEKEADQVIFLKTPTLFYAVGQFYEEFEQTNDEEVMELLK
jgi:putative phosphoribosyl transferase